MPFETIVSGTSTCAVLLETQQLLMLWDPRSMIVFPWVVVKGVSQVGEREPTSCAPRTTWYNKISIHPGIASIVYKGMPVVFEKRMKAAFVGAKTVIGSAGFSSNLSMSAFRKYPANRDKPGTASNIYDNDIQLVGVLDATGG
eukprot:TRINITY_DN1009_c4_g2_i1.p3 TRINITY_DN1009_c4_g2~~TRINITY_DN1009_c4_g2_i1.p3  ORF type:complete len:143 (-),score=23.93 TRINITY_DN1009_c4_g2_i1:131-559(-)